MTENFKVVSIELIEPVSGANPDKPARIFKNAPCAAINQSLQRSIIREPEIYRLCMQRYNVKTQEEAEKSF